jgi:flagellar protein FlaJ
MAKETGKVKKIKAIKETNWLAITVAIAIILSAVFIVFAFLAQIGTIDMEGELDVIFDSEGNPIAGVEKANQRVYEVQGDMITYHTITESVSESEARGILAEDADTLLKLKGRGIEVGNGPWRRVTLNVDKGFELGEPPNAPFRIDGDMMNFIILAMIPPCAIPGIYIMRRDRNIKQIEDRLPDFLRDVAEAGRFGMTLADAIVVASGGRYGKLTPEIKKMAARIDWGVPANEAIRLFSAKVNTSLVNRVSAIIMKSNDAGGNVADVLTLVANDTKQVQLMDKERKLSMSTYIAVIYISFFVFLFTILILNSTFLPQMREAGEETSAMVSGEGGATVQIIQSQAISAIQFTYLIASLAHAVGDGLIAGSLSTGKLKNGLVHSFILLVCAFMLLRLIVYL